jgi:hypothetical protein
MQCPARQAVRRMLGMESDLLVTPKTVGHGDKIKIIKFEFQVVPNSIHTTEESEREREREC